MSDTTAPELFRRLDRELWVVTAGSAGRRGGLIATFVNQASLVAGLPRVLVGLAKHHHTWGLVEESGAFALHLLGEERLDWVWRFGLTSGHDRDKLAGLEWSEGRTGSPLLVGALGWLECQVEAKLDTGDRTVYLAEVVASQLPGPEAPLTTRRMLELAPAEKRRILQEQVARDSVIDASAIEDWRRVRRNSENRPA